MSKLSIDMLNAYPTISNEEQIELKGGRGGKAIFKTLRKLYTIIAPLIPILGDRFSEEEKNNDIKYGDELSKEDFLKKFNEMIERAGKYGVSIKADSIVFEKGIYGLEISNR